MIQQLSKHPLSRLAIINRGEPALRLIRAASDFSLTHAAPISTIAFYTDPDASSVYVRRARLAYDLGPALERMPDGAMASRYLNMDALEQALRATRATAAWVGWGFVAERPEFADLCEKLGIVFVGPTAAAMRALGDKIESKRVAERANVPVSPWTGGAVASVDDATAWAAKHGLPAMIKATAGGGGRGVRRVDSMDTLAASFVSARDEAKKAFGNGDVYLERVIERARHVEVQIVADQHGTVWAAGLRDCTLQRRHQKVVEEAPAVSLPPVVREELKAAAVRLAKEARYTSLGTVEFLYEPLTQQFFFMEMNTRIQVEHPVTEQTTGLDLVGLQLAIAAGEALPKEPPTTRGHAIEVRLCAEDPRREFAPSPGRLARFSMPSGPNVRVDSGYIEGEDVPSEFDSMLAKIIVTGTTRAEAIVRMRRALAEAQIFVRDGASNRAFLAAILASEAFSLDETHTRWLDENVAQLVASPSSTAVDAAVCFAAIHAYQAERGHALSKLVERVRRGRFELGDEKAFVTRVQFEGRSYDAAVAQSGPELFEVRIGSLFFAVTQQAHAVHSRVATVGSVRFAYEVFADARGMAIELDGQTILAGIPQGNLIIAPAPGMVQRVAVADGDAVSEGQVVVVLEAMKTEVYVRAQSAGRVGKVLVSAGMHVKPAAPLIELAESGGEEAPREAPKVQPSASSPLASAEPFPLELLERALLGFDLTPADLSAAGNIANAPPREVDALIMLIPILEQVSGLLSLFSADAQSRALMTIVRSGLPSAAVEPGILETLERLLARMGYRARGDDVWVDAIERMHRAHGRLEALAPVIAAGLGLWHEHHGSLSSEQRQAYKKALNVLTAVCPKSLAVLANASRRAHYLDFEQPLHDAELRAHEATTLKHMTSLLGQSHDAWPGDVLQSVAHCAEPVLATVARHFGDEDGPRLLLEVFLRRFYGVAHKIAPIVHTSSDGVSLAETSYTFESRTRRVVSFACPASALPRVSALLAKTQAMPDEWLLDALVFSDQPNGNHDASDSSVLAWVSQLPARIVRVCVMGMNDLQGRASVSYRTYARLDGQLSERALLRGVHPMHAGRFDLWRLRGFEAVRLASPEDIFVVSATGKDNAEDCRLFSYIHLRGASLGRLETMLIEATQVMSDHFDRTPDSQARWNRITILINDAVMPSLESLGDLFLRLAHQFLSVHLEKIVVLFADKAFHFAFDGKTFARVRVGDPSTLPIRTLSRYNQRVIRLRRRGFTYAYEIIRLLTPTEPNPLTAIPMGRFEELDLNLATGELEPVKRAAGENGCGIVVGKVANMTQKHPDGMHRIVLLGDASHDMGSLAEPECRRIIAAIDKAEREQLPIEWFAMSAGAAITMTTGTENLDWTARVLRRVIEFTQRGGEINVIVDAINVGAQAYWNAEATMLMHCKGALIMTPEGAMVLTGKKALEFAGAVSAADHQGIGGVDRVMGPNGETQYRAKDLSDAIQVLFRYYDLTYVAPGEKVVRRRPNMDAAERKMSRSPHTPGDEFATLGEVFSESKNPGRKRPFDVRSVVRALVDEGSDVLERWAAMRNAENVVVVDSHVGGHAASVIAIEASPTPRVGFVPADGPDSFSPGTLYPQGSKKLARALNAASGRRPVIVLANLSGFDGSPESLRKLQLELGAEIGRAVVNFEGRIVFCVLTRYHGGAYVVFSKALNPNVRALALPGAFASVIGGSAAAAVVFRQEVRKRTLADPRVVSMRNTKGEHAESALTQLIEQTEREKMSELAIEFDRFHDVNRAVSVGSLDAVVSLDDLRAAIIHDMAQPK